MPSITTTKATHCVAHRRAGRLAKPHRCRRLGDVGPNVNVWGAGIAQGLENAATILYLSYRHVSGSLMLRQLNGGCRHGADRRRADRRSRSPDDRRRHHLLSGAGYLQRSNTPRSRCRWFQ
jgi:hypothetical protein